MSAWLKTQWLAILGAALVTVFAVFPQALADRIKMGLNVANQRTAEYEEIATAYSTLTYGVDGIYQLYGEGVALDSINVGFAREIVKGYNDSLTQLMNNQYVYKDEIKKLWGIKFFFFHTDLPEKYDSLFRYIGVVDPTVNAMNWMGLKLQPLKDDTNYKILPQEKDSLQKQLPALKDKLDHLHMLTERMIEAME